MKTGLRILSLLLALALLPAIAMAEPTAQNILSDDPFTSLAAVGDALYALSYGALYHVDVGTGQLQKLTPDQKDLPADAALPAMDRLFADAQGLLAFDSGSSALYRIDVHQQPLTAQLLQSVDAWADDYMMDMAYQAPYLYAYGGGKVHRLHMDTGKTDALEAPEVRSIAPYKDGLLLAQEVSRAADGWRNALFAYDFDTGEKTPVADPVKGMGTTLAYDAATDTVYTTSNLALFALNPGETETTYIASIPKGDTYGLTLLPDQAALITDGDFLSLRPLAPGAVMPGSLTLLDRYGRSGDYRSFYQQHPEIDLNILGIEDTLPEKRFINEMLTQSPEVDVYLLTSQNLLDRIKEKGFALPLTDSPVIQRLLDNLEQPIQDAMMQDGQVYALPKEMFVNLPAYNKDAFAALGLTVPETYDEYYDFCIMWLEQYAQEHTEYPFDPFDNQMDLASVLTRIAAELERSGQPLDFETPAIRQLVHKIAQAARLPVPDNQQGNDWLFYLYFLGALPEKAEYLLLKLDKANELALVADAEDFRYLTINPYTKNPEAALQLVEGVAENLGEFSIIIDKTITQAVENPWFAEQLAAFDGRGDDLRAAIKTAQGAQKRDLETALAAFDMEREDFVRMNQYQFTQDMVERVRELTPSIYVSRFNPIWQLAQEYPDLFDEYRTNPAFNPDQFLSRLNGMIKTALAEQR